MDSENENSLSVQIDNKPVNTAAIRIAVFIAAIIVIVLAIIQFNVDK